MYPLYAAALLLAVAERYAAGGGPLRAEEVARTAAVAQTWWVPYHFSLNGPAWFLSNLVIFWVRHHGVYPARHLG